MHSSDWQVRTEGNREFRGDAQPYSTVWLGEDQHWNRAAVKDRLRHTPQHEVLEAGMSVARQGHKAYVMGLHVLRDGGRCIRTSDHIHVDLHV